MVRLAAVFLVVSGATQVFSDELRDRLNVVDEQIAVLRGLEESAKPGSGLPGLPIDPRISDRPANKITCDLPKENLEQSLEILTSSVGSAGRDIRRLKEANDELYAALSPTDLDVECETGHRRQIGQILEGLDFLDLGRLKKHGDSILDCTAFHMQAAAGEDRKSDETEFEWLGRQRERDRLSELDRATLAQQILVSRYSGLAKRIRTSVEKTKTVNCPE